MGPTQTIQLRVPKQELSHMTFAISTPKEIASWLESLPKINIGENSRLLYGAIQELNRYQTDPKNRFLLLEEIREPIHQACKSLSRYYLNQPIILNEKQSQIVKLTQALQNHLAIGYKIVLLDSLPQKKKAFAELRTIAAHRALIELSGNLFRYYQLYHPAPTGLWKEIHQIYSLADHYSILNKVRDDPSIKSPMSIQQCYYRALLLSLSSSNQLRQQEISQLTHAFNIWSEHCQLKHITDDPEPFVVDLNSDEGALYFKWKKDLSGADPKNLRYVNMSDLADIVQTRLDTIDQTDGVDFKIKVITRPVLRHLVQCWRASTERRFARVSCDGSLSLTIGLSATHYHLSGVEGAPDQSYLSSGKVNCFLEQVGHRQYKIEDEIRSGGDVWSLQAITELGNNSQLNKSLDKQETKASIPKHFIIHQCDLIDTSPGGYCLAWNGAVPLELKAGELVTIKEPKQNYWSVGIIRWIRKASETDIRLGLELLAPHAEPLNAKIFQKDGTASQPMHVIRLPELKAIKKPSTIITSALTFKVGHRVLLSVDDKEIRVLLQKELCSTASFSQFTYKILGRTQIDQANMADKNTSDAKANDEDFNSLWTSI